MGGFSVGVNGRLAQYLLMATAATIPVSEYLSSSYEVDCDYVDGELLERNVGEWQHGSLQNLLGSLFWIKRREWQVKTSTEQRVQVRVDRYRVPDVCVMRKSDQVDRVVKTPPLICIEVLSPEDRWQRVLERVRDFQAMGVENIWILDPATHDAWIARNDGTQQHVSDALTVPGTPIHIDLSAVWAELDDMQTPQ